ncbi:nucleoside triphosphate pyrophosphohydrolase [Microbulbifer flavimaris]|uniref:Nucleoside triphosphate pyrophosphohydrolase n=1 Tax=Microbulbifer flavimaris TaxID=1781068 RepID=A0ABX4I204_9GAMM|nr:MULTISPECIES: nucleoside triphosphate pyrophosphohydrolase [Microbulbifer]KUJ84375.1 nucleoside triphosphate hydrolase [Microbulbifer sp. ZGT114]PCO06459.1 nucleoside triphosphate pyrophosphohydrolase [Microbulbifer flavimaris]
MDKHYSVDDLLYLMAQLRNPDGGCPWDLKQNFASIVPSTIEEAYEVAEAIEAEDFEHLHEELGDLLFQVIFYAQLGREAGHFDFSRIVDTLVRKLVRRHPHVFPSGQLYGDNRTDAVDEAQVKKNWEAIKAEERQAKGEGGTLDGVAVGLPALTRAAKLQKRASGVGFDWPSVDGVLAKIEEEIAELRAAIAAEDEQHAQEELGDLLFTCVNAARHLKVDPEAALRGCNRKFERRFSAVEQQLQAQGRQPSDASLEELDQLWNRAKQQD